ncbi:MAG: hypothetical protein QM811_13850 [Pirellulales bacterium]
MLVIAGVLALGLSPNASVACPFCGAVSATFTEEIELADMAVYAELVKSGDKAKPAKNPASTISPARRSSYARC